MKTSRAERFRTALAIALLVIILASGFLAVRSTHYPNGQETYCEKDDAGHEDCATYDVALVAFWKFGKFLDDHNGAINALAAIAVAAFTGTLWWSTRKLWRSADDQRKADEVARIEETARFARTIKIAEDSAGAALKSARAAERALTELERPYVFVDAVESNVAESISEVMARPPTPTVKIMFRNFGRTPAIIERLGVRLRLSSDDGFLPVMDSTDLVLGAGDQHPLPDKYTGPYSSKITYQIRGGELSIWLAFSIEYRDIFGADHKTSADWKYYRFDEWHPESGPRYHTVT